MRRRETSVEDAGQGEGESSRADLRRRFPRAEAVVRRDDKGDLVCEVADDGISWGYVGMPVEFAGCSFLVLCGQSG